MLLAAWWLSKTDDRVLPALPQRLAAPAGRRGDPAVPPAEHRDRRLLRDRTRRSRSASASTVSQDLTYTIGWLVFGMGLLTAGICPGEPARAHRGCRADCRDDVQVLSVRSRLARRAVSRWHRSSAWRSSLSLVVARAAEVRAGQASGERMTHVASGFSRTSSVASALADWSLALATSLVMSVSAQAPQFSHERPLTSVSGQQRLPVDRAAASRCRRAFASCSAGDRWIADGGLGGSAAVPTQTDASCSVSAGARASHRA